MVFVFYPLLQVGVPGQNVIMIIKGDRFNTGADKPVIIGTHYDTMSGTQGKSRLFFIGM